MFLFQKRFHEGLKSGAITLTFRQWPSPRVKPGGRYRVHPLGVMEVDAIEKVRVGTITDADAQRAGFESARALRDYMNQVAKEPLRANTEVFRVRMHYGGDGDRVATALNADLSSEEVALIAARLQRLDERSETGPWTKKTLAVISRSPRIAASKLAPKLALEKDVFKANVVKLKKLGLTQSFEVGYELSPRGRAFLKRKPKG